ncbi:lytic polysaccharide monooxygenase auxiliary activity family 9 protein [Actinopolymorpha alba]|uniref:lytic polysaccharide monooxygenase auxiliary activity family 9 protein n=1 Tax=Actinopolymorpha alba TaxID=533267 RepID=UPI00037A1928|nr:lytic polysaccharide monooxygenase auxiliary activity family 9 protein [Actinopolymorpha alba]
MSVLQSVRRPLLTRALVVSLGAALLATVGLVDVASAHGSVVAPASRAYSCLQRWGDNFQDPKMRTEDPMCYQAWRADPAAMWNWNGLYRENLADDFRRGIPDGTLCSGGRAEGGRYDALDKVGPWVTTPVSNNFRVRLFDQASHGTDFIRVYVTRQGFDPVKQPLRWSDLEPIGKIGNTPASEWKQAGRGVSIDVPASAPGRTGRHMIYTIWQASHQDQAYFLCSDVTFPGGSDKAAPSQPEASEVHSTSILDRIVQRVRAWIFS